MDKVISIGVRELVEFLMRSGSIDTRFGGADRALEGSRIHRKLQKAEGDNYKPEVALSLDRPCGDFILRVSGRADGVLLDTDGAMVDEIKSTAAPLEMISEDLHPVYWAQAMCYAYMYCIGNKLDAIRVRLTYYQIETEDIVRYIRSYSIDELDAFYSDLVEGYRKWSELQRDWNDIRDTSIKALQFPYPEYRRGQRQMAVSVYKAIRDYRMLFAQAPTGIGKTISTIFPAVKAIREGIAERIFYLTAKTITRQVAENACREMRNGGLRLKTVTLTAKDKICFLEERKCNPEDCPYANGHFDRVNDVLYQMLQSEDSFDRETIERYAKIHTLCPFELGLDLTVWSDCVIADYNYVFDPQVYLRRFFAEGSKRDYVFLVDEAHNLVDRAREMYSALLSKSTFLQMRRRLDKQSRLRKTLSRINTEMLALRKECGEETVIKKSEPDVSLLRLLYVFTAECEEWMKLHPDSEHSEELLSLYFDVIAFLKISELYDERYITMVETDGTEVLLRLICLDPSMLLRERMQQGRSAVLFSATLTPLEYFCSVLGGDSDSVFKRLPSPFPRENLCLVINNRISTRYRDRERSISAIADLIAAAVKGRTGNYIVYFPSYVYMNNVYGAFCQRYPDIETVIQSSGMSELEREEFLEKFSADNEHTFVGFCVLGGIYAEGIDLQGNRLIGAIIIGVGLPQINPVQDIIREYYDKQNGMGYAFAYRYPGMNKVLQAAGRVIRGEYDRGVVVLIDDRLTTNVYRRLLPQHWAGYELVQNTEQLQRAIQDFWNEKYI
ncbi:MAG: ATP-dependent DNA helicase [Clostridiales bacterium]|nr:ATP-dependent DNA helicase [Clostridiales bacterium]